MPMGQHHDALKCRRGQNRVRAQARAVPAIGSVHARSRGERQQAMPIRPGAAARTSDWGPQRPPPQLNRGQTSGRRIKTAPADHAHV